LNRKVIDPIVPRYTAVSDKVLFTFSNGPKTAEQKAVLRHKKNPSLGNKVVTYSSRVYLDGEDAKEIAENEEITLMDWGNAIVRKIIKNADGKVTELHGELHLEGDFKTTSKKLTWLAESEELIPIVVRTYDYLITKKKLEEEDKLEDWVNPHSLVETHALGDSGLRLLCKGEKIQLERKGYYICDQPFLYPNKPMILITIPDGHPRAPAVPAPGTPIPLDPSFKGVPAPK